jgi:DinB superfamily
MNPYAVHMGDRDALDVIAATPQQLRSLIETLGPERARQPPAPGKWSAREVLCHLADGEIVFAFRLRQTLAEEHHVIQPFDQDLWAGNYGAYSVDEALAVFSAVRRWNLALIRRVIPQARSRPVTHPERGQMTFQTILETMAGHDRNHVLQIERIAAHEAEA